MTGGEELSNSVGFLEVAFRSLKKGELVSRVQSLILRRSSCLFAIDDESEVLACEFAYNSAAVYKYVSGELCVNFLQNRKAID